MRSTGLLLVLLLVSCGKEQYEPKTVDYSGCQIDSRCDSTTTACATFVRYDESGQCFCEIVPSGGLPSWSVQSS